MKRSCLIPTVLLGTVLGVFTGRGSWMRPMQAGAAMAQEAVHPDYMGSSSCRPCHERFYQLWAPSHHGLAMQPFTTEFAAAELAPTTQEVAIGEHRYGVEFDENNGWVHERGPDGENAYRMEHVLGGKYVYYILTKRDRGRLQTLPLAYDVEKKEWFDTAGSGVRHFEDTGDEPLPWTHRAYTFNTSCYNCHVSQLATNYDLESDVYGTVWAEPGINCETCHGPGKEHIRVCEEAPEGETVEDLKLTAVTQSRGFTAHQANTSCAPCHAQMIPLTNAYKPGDEFFEHYDLTALEDPDFYPDGRDLGENYTYTLWRMSPCTKSGRLDCLHCHTSSGRYRFDGEKANQACMPCHEDRVLDATPHTHHEADSAGSLCVSCHMPMTEFARMRRSDHSMLPPSPAATLAFGSPNACNLCHSDQDAEWADGWVRKWHPGDSQAETLFRANLVRKAREHDWSSLPQILKYLESKNRDEVYAVSLIRLLRTCSRGSKWPVLTRLLKDPSPWVRSAAADGMHEYLTPEVVKSLLKATEDPYLLVRIRAAGALAPYPRERLSEEDRGRLERATKELITSLLARPDDYTSHYNLGNHLADRGDLRTALAAYTKSSEIAPDSVLPLVNAAMIHARMGENSEAHALLLRALEIEPKNPVVNFNLGLLLAEEGDRRGAEKCLRSAAETGRDLPEAAYNLGVLLAEDRLNEAVKWCRKAYEARPDDVKYGYTLAFYLHQAGDWAQAVSVLQGLIEKEPADSGVYVFYGAILEEQGREEDAVGVYRRATENRFLSEREKEQFSIRIRSLSNP